MNNLPDLNKAKIVKEQKKVLKEVVKQRMAIRPATQLLKYIILTFCVWEGFYEKLEHFLLILW